VPDLFFAECGAVLRRWDLNNILAPNQIADAISELMVWPLRVAQIRGLFLDAWRPAPLPWAAGGSNPAPEA
jgi:hypothetical protein